MPSAKNVTGTLLIIIIAVLALQACTTRNYRLELDAKGIPYTLDAFIDSAKNKNREIVELFVYSGFDVNACKLAASTSEDNENALYAAVWNGDLQMVKLLLNHGYNATGETCQMKTPPLHLAAMRGRVDIASLIIRNGADINRTDSFGMTPLMLAVQMRHADMVNFLRSKGAK